MCFQPGFYAEQRRPHPAAWARPLARLDLTTVEWWRRRWSQRRALLQARVLTVPAEAEPAPSAILGESPGEPALVVLRHLPLRDLSLFDRPWRGRFPSQALRPWPAPAGQRPPGSNIAGGATGPPAGRRAAPACEGRCLTMTFLQPLLLGRSWNFARHHRQFGGNPITVS
jgi:hypothetical protein